MARLEISGMSARALRVFTVLLLPHGVPMDSAGSARLRFHPASLCGRARNVRIKTAAPRPRPAAGVRIYLYYCMPITINSTPRGGARQKARAETRAV